MQSWLAGGLAIISLMLPVGRHWLKDRPIAVGWLKQRWMSSTADFFYFVGLPYVALVFGVVTPKLLGLKGLEYFALISSDTVVVDLQPLVMLVLLEWLGDVGPMLTIGFGAALLLCWIIFLLTRYGVPHTISQTSALYTLYHTIHWAFYWALFWLLTDDLYLGIVFGSAWVLLEWFLIARVRKIDFFQEPLYLVDAIILILTATIFFYYPNLWLLWLIHLAMVVLTRLISTSVTRSKYMRNPQ